MRTQGHVRQPRRHDLPLRGRPVGAQASRGVLVEGRREGRQRGAAHPAVGRPARPRASTGACSTRSSRRGRWPSSNPRCASSSNEVIDAFVDRGECDFHEDFATPLPSTFFIALMGLPQTDLPQFLQWRDDTIRPTADTLEEADSEIRERTGQRDHRVLRSRDRGAARPARRPAAQRARRTPRSTAGRSRMPSCSARATS